MLRMAHQHQPFVADALDGQSGPPPGIGHQPKVHLVVQHQLMHPVNVFVADLDLNPGERLSELPEDGLELMQAEAEAGGQFKEVGGGFPGQLHLAIHFPVEPENLPAMGVADLALRRQLEMSRIPHGELDAEFVLQGREQLAGIGRGAAVYLRRPGKTPGFDHIAEHPQGPRPHYLNEIIE